MLTGVALRQHLHLHRRHHHRWLLRPRLRSHAAVQTAVKVTNPPRISNGRRRASENRGGGLSWPRSGGRCSARRRVRYEEEEEEEEYGSNLEIAVMESYSESKRNEALLVRATVDGEEELILIFKGFSSSLSSRTATDPSRSVLPARAVIRSIDVIKGPFDPSNIQYIDKGLTWEGFRSTRL